MNDFHHTAAAQLKLLIYNFAGLKLVYQIVAETFPWNSVAPRKYVSLII